MGRGLYVKRNIKIGELLIAEKAIAFTKENKNNDYVLSLNINEKKMNDL